MAKTLIIFLLFSFAALAAGEPSSSIMLVPEGKGDFKVYIATGETIHSAYPNISLLIAEEAYQKGEAITYDTVTEPDGFWGFNLKEKIFATKWAYSALKIKAPERSLLEEKNSSNTSGLVLFCLALWVTAAFLLRFYLRSPAFSNFIILAPLLFAIFYLVFAGVAVFVLELDVNNLAANITAFALGIISAGIIIYFSMKNHAFHIPDSTYGFIFWLISLLIIFLPFFPPVVHGKISGAGLAIFILAIATRLFFPPKHKIKIKSETVLSAEK